MPTKPLAADFKVLTSESGAGVIEATSRLAHDHSHSATDVVGREKTRTKASTGGRIEETGKIGGEFKVQSNPEFLKQRKDLFDSIVAAEKERIAGVYTAVKHNLRNFIFIRVICSEAARANYNYHARWCCQGRCIMGNHTHGHCCWNFQKPREEGCGREGSCRHSNTSVCISNDFSSPARPS